MISIDGSTGEVVVGAMELALAEPPKEFDIVLGWADTTRKGKLGVRANADTGEDAANARRLGAEGIGLCRTEHMFLAPDRLPVVRKMILASTPDEENEALAELLDVQRADFEEVLEAMDGLPVTVRLLDPPLHEFLPSIEELHIKEATDRSRRRREEAARRRRVVGRAQPDDRHPRRPPRRRQAEALRHAGARPDGGGRQPAQARARTRSSR